MNRLRSVLMGLIVLAVLGLPSTGRAADRVRASYAALNASQSPLWVAQAEGFYAKNGLDVDLIHIGGGSLNVQALVGESVQFAAGGPAAVQARLRGIKLLIIANPLPFLASNLVGVSGIKTLRDLKGKLGGISRFGSSTDQGLQYLFRKAGLNPETDRKILQLGGDANRLAALKIGKIQYTFLGASTSAKAKTFGFRVLATARQMAIPFPWTSVVVREDWLNANRDVAYRYVKSLTEAIWFMKHNRRQSEAVIAKYMKTSDPAVAREEYDFNIALLPDLPYPSLDGVRLILQNLARVHPRAAGLDPREFVDSSLVERLKKENFLGSLGGAEHEGGAR